MLSPQREADLRLIKAALKRSNYREGEKHIINLRFIQKKSM